MKKSIMFVGLLVLSALSMGEEIRKAYVLVPYDTKLEDIKLTAEVENKILNNLDEDGNPLTLDYFTESGSPGEGELGVIVQKSNASTYGTNKIKYVEVVVANAGASDEVKFIMGYPVAAEIPTYNLIADDDISSHKSTLEGHLDDGVGLDELMDMIDFDIYDFPGRELQDGMIISGVRVGEDVISEDEGSLHSNIVELLSKTPDPEDPEEPTITKVDIDGISINPNKDGNENKPDGTFEFKMWAVKTNAEGKIEATYDDNGDEIYKKDIYGNDVLDSDGNKVLEGERVLLYVGNNQGSSTDNPLYGDLHSLPNVDGQIYPVDGQADPFPNHDHFIFDTSIRFQAANGEVLKINNQEVTIGGGKGEWNWQFFNIDEMNLYMENNKIYFGMKASGGDVGIIPGGDTEVPPAIAAEYYVLDDSGQTNEKEAAITSRYVEAVKYRSTNVKMKVMSDDGSYTKSLEVMNIEE